MKRYLTLGVAFLMALMMMGGYQTDNYAAVNPEQTAQPADMNGFIRAEGAQLVDGSGNPFLIKGMAFGNAVWNNPSVAPRTHHTEDSYRELSELGFNSIRFYLNYGLFESDSDPYNYEGKDGWEWLDWNIQMAKKYNIRLVLNMHYPQGGYQSLRNGMALWTDVENQNRLTALWTEIARRYKDETAIAAFGLVNEPFFPEQSTVESTLAQWQELAQRITDSIRTVDQNHLIMVERSHGYKNIDTGKLYYGENVNGNMNYFLIDDPNVAYEFHTYEPFYYTAQNASWEPEFIGKFASYPDENKVMNVSNRSWAGATFSNPILDRSRDGWQELKGQKFQVANTNYKVGMVALQVYDIGSEGTVWVDDITVNEYDADGNFVRQIHSYDFDEYKYWYFWGQDGNGSASYSYTEGHTANGCYQVSGTTSDANIADEVLFPVTQGYYYEISGWVKGENIGSNAITRLRVDFLNGDEVEVLNKDYLEKSLTKYLKFGTDYNVPIYLGEFGVISDGFKQNRGGDRWVRDMIDLCKKYNVNFNYHTYHEAPYGLYQNNEDKYPANLNTALYDVFEDVLKD